MSEAYLDMVHELKIFITEEILVRILLLQRGEHDSINSEEGSIVIDKVILFNIGSRSLRHPKSLRIRLDSSSTNKRSSNRARPYAAEEKGIKLFTTYRDL